MDRENITSQFTRKPNMKHSRKREMVKRKPDMKLSTSDDDNGETRKFFVGYRFSRCITGNLGKGTIFGDTRH
jgi:hypothetical protein